MCVTSLTGFCTSFKTRKGWNVCIDVLLELQSINLPSNTGKCTTSSPQLCRLVLLVVTMSHRVLPVKGGRADAPKQKKWILIDWIRNSTKFSLAWNTSVMSAESPKYRWHSATHFGTKFTYPKKWKTKLTWVVDWLYRDNHALMVSWQEICNEINCHMRDGI